MAKAVDLSKYNFGEKEFETINGVECPVWQTPKYIEAKKKVIETLQSDKYKDILDRSEILLDPEYLITTIKTTHDAIHYGDDSSIFTPIVERSKYDTCPWKQGGF